VSRQPVNLGLRLFRLPPLAVPRARWSRRSAPPNAKHRRGGEPWCGPAMPRPRHRGVDLRSCAAALGRSDGRDLLPDTP